MSHIESYFQNESSQDGLLGRMLMLSVKGGESETVNSNTGVINFDRKRNLVTFHLDFPEPREFIVTAQELRTEVMRLIHEMYLEERDCGVS